MDREVACEILDEETGAITASGRNQDTYIPTQQKNIFFLQKIYKTENST